MGAISGQMGSPVLTTAGPDTATIAQNGGNLGSSLSDFSHRVNHLPSVNAGLNINPSPAMAGIQNPVAGAAPGAQAGVGNSLASQQALLSALQAQGGAANQSAILGQGQGLYGQLAGNNGVGTQAAATGQQGALNSQLGGSGGVGLQQGAASGLQNVLGQQQRTAGQLQGIASGRGPNPAQAALNQSTGQNVANQGALMAGQRGAGANVGLLARQAAQQGAATQQQAVGQGATMQAKQELGALGQLTGQQQAMAGTNQAIGGIGSGLVGQQQTGINNQFGEGAATVGQQQGQLATNAGIAQNQVGNQIGATNQYAGNQIANQGQVLGAQGQYNADITSGQGNVNTNNTSLTNTAMQGRQGVLGGLMNSAGPALSAVGSLFAGSAAGGSAAAVGSGGYAGADAAGADAGDIAATAARGGYVGHQYADGGDVDQPDSGPAVIAAPTPVATPNPNGPQSSFGQFLSGKAGGPAMTAPQKLQTGTESLLSSLMPAGAAGGSVSDFRGGGGVKAKDKSEKATKPGNSYANDKVKAVLSEGEVVIPRSVMQSRNPSQGAADFVRKVMAKKGRAS